MGELYGLAGLVLAFVGTSWLALVKLFPGKPKGLNKGGTWRRVQETIANRDGTFVRIVLVRELEGEETGRLPVFEVSTSEEDWNSKYIAAIAEADTRLAALQSAEQH